MKTLGGRQFWMDVIHYGGWRIQRNVFSGSFRLLDPDDLKRDSGSLEQCESTLEGFRKEGQAQITHSRLCVLLHGFLRSRVSMARMFIGLQHKGYEVYGINYPSAQMPFEQIAAEIHTLLHHVSVDFDEINLVTHSMGGIIARYVLSMANPPPVSRLVMIAPPNQGSHIADIAFSWWPSNLLMGPASRQLGAGSENATRIAGIPHCEFGIIAGHRSPGHGWNPMLPGEDDGLVTVHETILDGATDTIRVQSMHTFIPNHPETIRQTIHFLENGLFQHMNTDID